MNYYYIYNFNVLPACRRRDGSWWSTCLPEGIDVALWGMTCPISARQYREPTAETPLDGVYPYIYRANLLFLFPPQEFLESKEFRVVIAVRQF